MGAKKKRQQKEKTTDNSVSRQSAQKFSSSDDDDDSGQQKPKSGIVWKAALALLGVILAVVHRNHCAFMFESDRHFSHLSDLEREMTFRTEMGLYFSYYKTIIEEPTFLDGLYLVTHDNVSEFGHTINTLKRFNLYPEVLLAALYRTYKSMAANFGWKIQECWVTNRGEGLDPISSCEGMGNSHYFYINHVFAVAGSLTATLFFYGILLSDSVFGGLLSVAAFFFNHGEATRVQWTPPLRESFGYPIFALQMLIVSYIVKHRVSGVCAAVSVALFTISFMLPWQFAQFALSTQVGSLFVCYVFDYIPAKTLRTITFGHLTGFTIAFVLLFGNEMLLTSLFLSSIISVQLILCFDSLFNKIRFRPLVCFIQVLLFAIGTLGIKYAIGNVLDVKDDAHIFDILKSKFTDYSNFHTRLYTCAVEFDFLEIQTFWKLLATLLLPSVCLALILVLIQLIKIEWQNVLWKPQWNVLRLRYAHIVYNCIQLAAFTLMALLIMRLKLFWTPHLCIVASLLASKRLCYDLFGSRVRPVYQQSFCVCLIAGMAVVGLSNISQQRSVMGEYSNLPQERLFEWIHARTDKDAVFAGAMPTMANVKLSTNRPIVMHPHYEDVQLRERVRLVYSVYSRRPATKIHETLKQMGVNYFVFEYGWCSQGGNRPECGLITSWDIDEPENREHVPFCDIVEDAKSDADLAPFKLAYRNEHYKVLRVV